MAQTMRYKLTVRDADGEYTTYESNKADELIEQLRSLKTDEPEDKPVRHTRGYTRPMTPYERTRAAVYATGNKWAIENFHATHG